MKRVTIFCDGACEGNPGPGGWAATLIDNQQVREISGGTSATTNNRMELQAAIEALRALKEPCEIMFFTDSQYLRKGISQWLPKWKVRKWKTTFKTSVKNEDLWRELDAEAAKHRITWKWIKGHAGHEMNERCDRLAKSEILKVRQQFTSNQLKMFLVEFQQSVVNNRNDIHAQHGEDGVLCDSGDYNVLLESVTITDRLLDAGKSERGGWSKAQLTILGVAWPLQTGWKDRVRGRIISQSKAERFVSLRSGAIARQRAALLYDT